MEQSPYHFILKTNFDPIIIFKIQYIYYYYFFMCVQKPVKPVFANSLKSQLKTFFPPLNFHCLIILFSSPLSFLEQQVSFSSFSPLFFCRHLCCFQALFGDDSKSPPNCWHDDIPKGRRRGEEGEFAALNHTLEQSVKYCLALTIILVLQFSIQKIYMGY